MQLQYKLTHLSPAKVASFEANFAQWKDASHRVATLSHNVKWYHAWLIYIKTAIINSIKYEKQFPNK